jgi:peptidyl-prolyl cis-trans isomerase SurA
MRFIKNILILVVLISSSAALALDYKDYEPLDKIIAIVEKDVITEKEMEEALLRINESLQGINALDRPNKAEIRKTVLDQLIEKKIIGQYAEQNQLIIDSEQIDNALKNIAANNSISLKQLKESAQKKGSLDSLYKEVRFQLTLRMIKERAIYAQINISDYEIKRFIEKRKLLNPDQYSISHILIKKNNGNEEELYRRLKKVLEELQANSFADVAKQFSDGPFAEKFGFMGWFELNSLPNIFVDHVKGMNSKEISEPFVSDNGYHILMLNEIKSTTIAEKIYSTQYNINQILLKKNQVTPENDLITKLNNIKNQISFGGLPFGDAAAQYSEDASSAKESGVLGWVDRNNLLPEFQVELDNATNNSIIGPFKTSAGWHLIELIEKREKDVTEESLKLSARYQLLNYKAEIKYIDWFHDLKQQSNIEILTDN